MRLLTSLFALLITINSSFASAYETIICDNCSSNSDFELLAASAQKEGLYVIANTKSEKVQSYNVFNEPLLGGYIAVITANPQDVEGVIQSSKNAMKAASFLQSLLLESISLSSEPNGCGGADDPLNVLIPQEPFREACNAHDICYSNGTSRSVCDTAFLENMSIIIDQKMELIRNENNEFLIALHKNLLLDKLKVAFYAFVDKFGIKFYCKDGLNAETSDCKAFQHDLGGTLEFLGKIGESTETVVGFNGLSVNVVCNIIAYRIYINSNAGSLNVIEDCRVAEL